jgi:hypothetical protein
MNGTAESAIGVVAALLVLFGAMVDPRISVAVAVVSLLALAGYRWYLARGADTGR